MLLNKGVGLTPRYIEALKEHGVLAVAIEGISELDSARAECALKESVLAQAMGSLQDWVEKSMRQEEFAGVVESVNSIVTEILLGKIPLGGLAEISVADSYIFSHSIDVCAFSVYMGVNLGFSKDALLDLGIGSILHDLGKVRVSPDILNKSGKLTDDEFSEVKKHPKSGCDMLKENVSSQVSDSSLEIVLNHHERYDGSGYPRGISGGEISDLTYICALADIYCAMTAERVYRKAFPSNEVYEMIMAYGDRYIKYELVKTFSICVCPFPIGTLVLLNTGVVGCVAAANSSLPFRPVVSILGTQERVDLSRELYLVIERVLTPKEAQHAILKVSSGKIAPIPPHWH